MKEYDVHQGKLDCEAGIVARVYEDHVDIVAIHHRHSYGPGVPLKTWEEEDRLISIPLDNNKNKDTASLEAGKAKLERKEDTSSDSTGPGKL